MPALPSAIQSGNLAVITGGASGIGLALAKVYLSRGLSVAVGDNDAEALAKVPKEMYSKSVNVADSASLAEFRDAITKQFPGRPISILHANAGVGGPTKASDPQGWDRIMGVNYQGVVSTVHTFLPLIKAGGQPAMIVNSGSKQGITTPPGSGAAYNISKAAVRVFTEQLAHELRGDESTKDRVTAHLLIPGWVHTGLTGAKTGKPKPEGAWSAEQTADFALDRIASGSFYILCPDNETPAAVDKARMEVSGRKGGCRRKMTETKTD